MVELAIDKNLEMQNKTFILGVGSQKSGTTWLYHYLRALDHTCFSNIKEFHYFDSLYLSDMKWYARMIKKSVYQSLLYEQMPSASNSLQLAFLTNPGLYFQYFYSQLYMFNDRFITGDITPAYSMLDAKIYENIKTTFENMGIQVKVIYLMRDPAQRLVSSLRQREGRRAQQLSTDDELRRMNQELSRGKASSSVKRGCYQQTIHQLEQVFDRQDIYYGLFEELFTKEQTQLICSFLGVNWKNPDFHKRYVATYASDLAITNDCLARIYSIFQDSIEEAVKIFGSSKIQELWPEAFAYWTHTKKSEPT
ncbi:sulfotransferase [Synechococcus sp. AH-551-B05]|nr:sulfotransferase domain-containing protein [Synechococcus sp. AH-551-B05]MDB4677331.1 sulfotransferase [Synechococcus sp. AH-551-B05]